MSSFSKICKFETFIISESLKYNLKKSLCSTFWIEKIIYLLFLWFCIVIYFLFISLVWEYQQKVPPKEDNDPTHLRTLPLLWLLLVTFALDVNFSQIWKSLSMSKCISQKYPLLLEGSFFNWIRHIFVLQSSLFWINSCVQKM